MRKDIYCGQGFERNKDANGSTHVNWKEDNELVAV